MSALHQVHLDIAKERFLDMMATGGAGADARAVAHRAIDQAYQFAHAYRSVVTVVDDAAPRQKLKGCKACFGSGGKVDSPCKACAGSGKVAL